ncbi:XAC2610-related protein [Pedobacter sp. SL55]|uniref:XAC2610-related protein n=1 Tax=Pedobacter sp. SL55 TaxID=2995161 RepID=UPI00226D9612|nr:hypothetical protein [Pedobacter sp. SL55]WAC42586.1 hypothetical protein OVA16_09590 [Pedobacter sp. SL55]
MKKILIILLSALSFFEVKAQEAKVTSIINFTGTVGNYPIEMKLELDQQTDSVAGEYYYTKNSSLQKILLEGILEDGTLTLQEEVYNDKKGHYEKTGSFRLNYVDQIYLNGNWQKPGENAKELTVKLTARENLKTFSPSSYVFQYTRNRVKLDYLPADAQYYFNLLSLKVFVNKSMRWAFVDFDDVYTKEAEIILQDLNFDGYLDFKVPIYYPGLAKGDYAYRYFIYHPAKRGFIQNKQLNDMGVVFFDAVKKEAQTVDADGSGNEGTQYFKWQNGKLFIVKEERVYEDDPYMHYTYYKIENGKSVLIKTEKKK